jgi:uncharacterized protein (DUF305 family)
MERAADARLNWKAAVLLGLLSSSYSTIISQFAAGRIGRDAAVDWMTVASIPLRDFALHADPPWSSIIAGIAFHQWADFSWAVFLFGALQRFTSGLSPRTLAVIALPWAVFTSALEWLFLVPVIPFWQPLFTLQQPYWIGFLVHASSAAVYPLFPELRSAISQRSARRPMTSFAAVWSGGLATAMVSLALLAALPRELPWAGCDQVSDRTYIRHMVTHHAQGIELGTMAVGRATDPHLRALAALMVASQAGENRLFETFWDSWFDEPMAACTAEERRTMPGFLGAEQLAQLRSAPTESFDHLFVALMTEHHKGAVAMADRELQGKGDLRLRVMAHAIRHAQQGEIALMRNVSGPLAVSLAIQNVIGVQRDP